MSPFGARNRGTMADKPKRPSSDVQRSWSQSSSRSSSSPSSLAASAGMLQKVAFDSPFRAVYKTKNALYSTMANLNRKATSGASSLATTMEENVGSNAREPRLYEFYETVSNFMCRYPPPQAHSNNGGMPTPKRVFEQGIQHRSIILAEGAGESRNRRKTKGKNKGNASMRRQRPKRNGSQNNGNNKRRRNSSPEKSELVTLALPAKERDDASHLNQELTATNKEIYPKEEVLEKLNALWLTYVQDLLSRHSQQPGCFDGLELRGALVTVTRCRACSIHVGMRGYVVDVTANTWRILSTNSTNTSRGAENDTTQAKNGEEKAPDSLTQPTTHDTLPSEARANAKKTSKLPRVLMIPRKHSSIQVEIPLGKSNTHQADATTKEQSLRMTIEGT